MTLFCDNLSTKHLAQNHVFHEKTKHLERDTHYVREQVETGLHTTHISSANQLGDVLTKPLAAHPHYRSSLFQTWTCVPSQA